jgi:hypothetical protein
LLFGQLSVLSICLFVDFHFANLPFCQLAILSTCNFANLPFCQLVILPTSHFANLSFYQLAILPTCQLAVPSKSPFLNSYFFGDKKCYVLARRYEPLLLGESVDAKLSDQRGEKEGGLGKLRPLLRG